MLPLRFVRTRTTAEVPVGILNTCGGDTHGLGKPVVFNTGHAASVRICYLQLHL